jgi:benzil reductase ((S)-benzoin forming)
MNYFIITGTSRGIGKAIAEILLEEKNNVVTGISRNQTIHHKRFKHFSIDLSDISLLKDRINEIFPKITEADKIILINNAGTLGQVGQVGKIESENFEQLFKVNLIAPVILINEFIKKYKDLPCLKIIMNISSGAGKHSVDGWSGYCSSKAALDMFSLVVNDEQQISGGNFKIYSVSPGIVDTQMQSEIRKASQKDFSRVSEFMSYKEKGELADAKQAAKKLLYILNNDHNFDQVLNTVRDIE